MGGEQYAKTEQKTEQQAGLGMSFCEEEGRITVFRKTLEALEWQITLSVSV